MKETRGITVKIAADLHARAKADQEVRGLTMSQYITLLIEEHFNRKVGENMSKDTRTMAFQIEEELFLRIKAHLSRTGLSQKAFVLGLIEQALAAAEAEVPEEEATEEPNADSNEGGVDE